MEYYSLIKDIDELEKFVEWLPDLKEYEKFYICLFARKKYDPVLQSTASDKMQLKRDLVNKQDIIQKIKQWEIPVGLYTLKQTPATQQSLALYISPNPRCMIKAQGDLTQRITAAIIKGNYFHNPKAEAISSCQRSKAYNYIVDFDIDTKDIDLNLLKGVLLAHDYRILETRGGYHVLVYPERATASNKEIHLIKQGKKGAFTIEELDARAAKYGNSFPLSWHKKITTLFDVDQTGDQLIPVPGCTQGNYVPKFISI
jgi:hypothetical protein